MPRTDLPVLEIVSKCALAWSSTGAPAIVASVGGSEPIQPARPATNPTRSFEPKAGTAITRPHPYLPSGSGNAQNCPASKYRFDFGMNG